MNIESVVGQTMSSKLCFNAFNGSPWTGRGIPLANQINAAANAGFPLVGVDRYTVAQFLDAGGHIRDIRRLLDGAGVRCGAITAAGMLGADPEALEAIGRAAEWARELNAPFVQINMGHSGAAQKESLEHACDALGGGPRLALEYMPLTPLNRVADAVALVTQVGLERAGVLIDVWHHERGPDTWEELSSTPAEAICYVEFDDALPATYDMAADTMNRRTFPGEGVLDLTRFVSVIRQTGFDGMISVEVLNEEWRERSIIDFARQAFESSTPYWS